MESTVKYSRYSGEKHRTLFTPCEGIWIPESEKFSLLESGIQVPLKKKKNQGPVPKRPISVNPGLKFCSVLVLHFYVLPRVTFCAIIAVSRSKGSTVFCNLELPALKTVLKIWLNPGLDLTIFRGTGTRNPIPRIWDPRRRIQSTRLWWNPLRRATLSPKGNS